LNLLPPYLTEHSKAEIACERPELQHHRMQGSLDEPVVFGSQARECVPAHPLRLAALAVENAGFPIQARSEPVRAPCCASASVLARAGVGGPIAVPTGEDAAAVEDRHAPPAADGRANESGTPTAEFAQRAHDAPVPRLYVPRLVSAVRARAARMRSQSCHPLFHRRGRDFVRSRELFRRIREGFHRAQQP
jgi:hypothetical protein